MPYYDLLCKGCSNEFSVLASMDEKIECRIPCPECGSTDLAPIYKAAPAFIKNRGEKHQDCPNTSSCGMTCPFARATGSFKLSE